MFTEKFLGLREFKNQQNRKMWRYIHILSVVQVKDLAKNRS